MVERALHGGFFRDYGIGPETFAATPLTPACDHYVSLPARHGLCGAVRGAAARPCCRASGSTPRSGDDIFARAAPGNPYRAWIDTYAGEEFATAVAADDRRHRPGGRGRRRPRRAPACTGPSRRRPASNGCSGTAPTATRPGPCDRGRPEPPRPRDGRAGGDRSLAVARRGGRWADADRADARRAVSCRACPRPPGPDRHAALSRHDRPRPRRSAGAAGGVGAGPAAPRRRVGGSGRERHGPAPSWRPGRFETCPRDLDVLFVPGGDGTPAQMRERRDSWPSCATAPRGPAW